MSEKRIAVRKIVEQGILPLFYCYSQSVGLDVVRTLCKAGVRAVEYTNRGVAALENFTAMKKTLSAEFPDLCLGIGTSEDAGGRATEAFVQAGADFIVAPIVNPAVAAVAQKAGLLWIPGCMTPTEIFQAQQHEAGIIKLFPAGTLGPGFLNAIRILFPKQMFIPTGGVEINEDNIREWFRAGVTAVGLGSKLISEEVLVDANYDLLYVRTQLAMQIAQKVKNEIYPKS